MVDEAKMGCHCVSVIPAVVFELLIKEAKLLHFDINFIFGKWRRNRGGCSGEREMDQSFLYCLITHNNFAIVY